MAQRATVCESAVARDRSFLDMKARFAEQPAYIIRALGFSEDVFDVPVLIIKDSRNART